MKYVEQKEEEQKVDQKKKVQKKKKKKKVRQVRDDGNTCYSKYRLKSDHKSRWESVGRPRSNQRENSQKR